ncbi:MAG: orotidine 5'-phosphate decarboxylase, partial [Planctomycetota bacterium]
MSFPQRLWKAVDARGTPAIVGLDPRPDHLPEPFRSRTKGASARETARAIREHHRALLDLLAPRVAA